LRAAAERVIVGQTGVPVLRERELLEAWQAGKTSRHWFCLASEFEAAFEFRGRQFGHPSNYAAIKIGAAPSNDFSLDAKATYAASVPASDAEGLLLAVGRAAVDELFAATWHPYRGCMLTVQEVGWDDVMSSQVAVYRAARGALSKIREEGQWTLIG
jgi:hypothetical protein